MAEIVLISFLVERYQIESIWKIKNGKLKLHFRQTRQAWKSRKRINQLAKLTECHRRNSGFLNGVRLATNVAHERNEFQFPEPSLQTEIAFSLQHQEN